ncbi:MAG: hypothetical protein RLZZ156_744 [Deinococcota bacterium]|jgi:pantothenate kinase type III
MLLKNLEMDLRNSQLQHGILAAQAIAQGWGIEHSEHQADCRELLSLYTIRRDRLSAMVSAHATQLAYSVKEFVENLEQCKTKTGNWIRVQGQAEYSFSIFCLSKNEKPIGCMKIVSKLEVTPERWGKIWELP